jgi:hypothetical protein
MRSCMHSVLVHVRVFPRPATLPTSSSPSTLTISCLPSCTSPHSMCHSNYHDECVGWTWNGPASDDSISTDAFGSGMQKHNCAIFSHVQGQGLSPRFVGVSSFHSRYGGARVPHRCHQQTSRCLPSTPPPLPFCRASHPCKVHCGGSCGYNLPLGWLHCFCFNSLLTSTSRFPLSHPMTARAGTGRPVANHTSGVVANPPPAPPTPADGPPCNADIDCAVGSDRDWRCAVLGFPQGFTLEDVIEFRFTPLLLRLKRCHV